MAYIRALVMSAYKEINCLISQPKHYVVGTQKNRRIEMVLLSTKIKGKIGCVRKYYDFTLKNMFI